MRRNPGENFEKAIGKSFATKQRTPLMGRVKRVFDLPSKVFYYGEKAYPKKFGTIPKADADAYAAMLGYEPPRRRAAAPAMEQNRRRRSRRMHSNARRSSRYLRANTLIRGVGEKAIATKLAPGMYQLVETTENSRMWDASYPITVAGYMTTGYLRDFKLGGIAKTKAKMQPGTRIPAAKKRKAARNID
jgi:hypothetical protein